MAGFGGEAIWKRLQHGPTVRVNYFGGSNVHCPLVIFLQSRINFCDLLNYGCLITEMNIWIIKQASFKAYTFLWGGGGL